jgi:pimeloyl-ACP methyl ester carboxylesterase
MTGAELRFEEVEGLAVGYRQAGRGAALVLLHGFLCDSRVWLPQLAGMSDSFTVIAWDAPGAGVSADPPGHFTTTEYARCLAGLLDRIGIGRAHIVGLSWGGILAQEFYRHYRERVRSLVLADTYAGWRGSLPEAAWKQRLATCLSDSTAPPAALVTRFVPGALSDNAPPDVREQFTAIVREFHPVGFRLMSLSSAEIDTRDLLPTIRAPTLVLWGQDDRRSPLHIAHQLHTAIPDAELAVIPRAGHLSNMEQPQTFNLHVRRFCAKHAAAWKGPPPPRAD